TLTPPVSHSLPVSHNRRQPLRNRFAHLPASRCNQNTLSRVFLVVGKLPCRTSSMQSGRGFFALSRRSRSLAPTAVAPCKTGPILGWISYWLAGSTARCHDPSACIFSLI